MQFIPFEPAHAYAFEAQGPQKPFLEWMTPDIARLAAAYFAFTGVDHEGVVGCAGLAPSEETDDLVAWALFSPRLFSNRIAVMRAVRQGLDLHKTRRIIAHVAPEHEKAARFAEALNFRLVGDAPHPSGRPVLLYAREC